MSPMGDNTPDPRSPEVLRRDLESFNLSHERELRRLEKHLSSPGGEETLGAIARFRAGLDRSPEERHDHDGSWAGAESFVALLSEHPSFTGDRRLGVGLPLFGETGKELEGLRRDAADLIVAGAIAIVVSGVGPRYLDVLLDVAVGADDFARRLRGHLLGHTPFPDDFGPIPQTLLDLIGEIDRKTCGLAISHAVSTWGQAVELARSRAWATGITSISPALGCAGDQVTIRGSGFGAAQPPGVVFAFARRGGGCTTAAVVSWSDSEIVVVAPPDVGAGCVGFLEPGDPAELVSATDSLAGELDRCLGLPAAGAARRFRTVGSRVVQECPPCLPLGVNYFQGGRPAIEFFSANGADTAEIAPAAPLTLSWSVRNATSIEIVAIPPPAGQADELPKVVGALNATGGSYAFPSVAGTFTWDREYELRARNMCTPPGQPVTKRVSIRMRSRPDLSLAGIEATQAIQFFGAAVHMPNAAARRADNAVRLITGKPTIVRVFVDSGQSPTFDGGKVAGVRARLHGRTPGGAALPGSPLAPLGPTFVPDPAHTIETHRRSPLTPQTIADERTLPATPRSFLFRLPAAWIAAGAIDVEAEVLPPPAAAETVSGNNRLTQRLVFNLGGLPIRIALLPVSYTDTPTGAIVAPPSLAQSIAELDYIQRVYPSNRGLLNVVFAPGPSNPWFFSGDLTATGPGCGMGWNMINAELASRAFFNFGFEDRVFVALLNRPPSGNAGPASGCGMPMSSLGGTVVGGAVLAGVLVGSILAGPFGAIVLSAALARLGSSALGVASALVTGAGVPAGSGGILAQEVGHGLGLMHVPGASAPPPFESPWPDYLGVGAINGTGFQSIGEFGLDVDDSTGFVLRAYSPQAFAGGVGITNDFMSYASPTDWVSPFIYERTMSGVVAAPAGFGPSPSRPLAGASDAIEPIDVALVSGILREEGSELRPIFTQSRRFAFGGREPDEIRLELRADDGTVLETRRVQRLDHDHDHGAAHDDGGSHGHRGAGDADLPLVFATAIPFHHRTAEIVIVHRDKELVREAVPARAPDVSVPRVTESKDGWLVRWRAKHERADDIRYLVRYAVAERDGEPLWQYLVGGLEEPRLLMPRGAIAGGAARVQVGASVAGRTAWVESEPFDVPHPSPEVAIVSPITGSRLTAGRATMLWGEAVTLEGSQIDDDHFVWVSDRDGELGRGRRLECAASLGNHTITLRVAAPERPEASASVRVVVVQGPLAPEIVPAAPAVLLEDDGHPSVHDHHGH